MNGIYDSQSHFVNMQPNGFQREDMKPKNSPAIMSPGISPAHDKYRKETYLPEIKSVNSLLKQIYRDILI